MSYVFLLFFFSFLAKSIFSQTLSTDDYPIVVIVEPNDFSEFNQQFRRNRVESTIGATSPPQISRTEVMEAINQFNHPEIIFNELKDFNAAGKELFVRFSYSNSNGNSDLYRRFRYSNSNDNSDRYRNNNALLSIQCGVRDKGNPRNQSSSYCESGPHLDGEFMNIGLRCRQNRNEIYADLGQYFQFKWASRAQIIRSIVSCLNHIPWDGQLETHLQPLPPPESSEEFEVIMNRSIRSELNRWLKSLPVLQNWSTSVEDLENLISCLIENAMAKVQDRIGRKVVLQRERFDAAPSFLRQRLEQGEARNLPWFFDGESFQSQRESPEFIYSISFMDEESLGNLNNFNGEGEIYNQGIWPNYLGGSVESLLAQIYGDEFQVHIRACLIEEKIALPNFNLINTFFSLQECHRIDSQSVLSYQIQPYLHNECELGNPKACRSLAHSRYFGLEMTCLPEDLGSSCFPSNFNQTPPANSIVEGQEYLQKLCEIKNSDARVVCQNYFYHLMSLNPHYARDFYQSFCSSRREVFPSELSSNKKLEMGYFNQCLNQHQSIGESSR